MSASAPHEVKNRRADTASIGTDRVNIIGINTMAPLVLGRDDPLLQDLFDIIDALRRHEVKPPRAPVGLLVFLIQTITICIGRGVACPAVALRKKVGLVVSVGIPGAGGKVADYLLVVVYTQSDTRPSTR